MEDIIEAGERRKPHFAGSILLEPLAGTATTVYRHAIVDGQQRLIMLHPPRPSVPPVEGTSGADRFLERSVNGLRRNYVFDDEAKGDYRYRLTPTKAARRILDRKTSVRGSQYFTYEGERLTDRCERLGL